MYSLFLPRYIECKNNSSTSREIWSSQSHKRSESENIICTCFQKNMCHEMFWYVGTDGSNLSHFWRAKNLVKFRNFKKCSQTPKDHALGHPSVKFQLMMSSQRGDIIICTCPFFDWVSNLSHFGLFVLVSARFLQSFGVMGQNRKYQLLY